MTLTTKTATTPEQRAVGNVLALLTEYALAVEDEELAGPLVKLLNALHTENSYARISRGCLTRLWDAGLTTSPLLGLEIPPDGPGYQGFLSEGREIYRELAGGIYGVEK
ncbi:hypothetical protein [Nocardia sp. NBC_01329]|uniref:hypothetical protein n=1 Tax=Nocardia sp. NBC_01329 TaxID=2903594 RepID=UPI002E10E328|nr:hypothetical protein OG405_02755 [Nocardia sp. NBC_01329]